MSDRGPGRPRATSREEIREVATRLFSEHGYAAVSLGRIAAEAGISRTTLFSYFPAKRDLVWQELRERAAAPEPSLASHGAHPLVDVIVDRILQLGRYPVGDRGAFAARWRIVRDDEELRAYGALQGEELALTVVAEALRRAPGCDARLVDHVVHALIAVATRSAEEWSRGEGAEQDLEIYTAAQLAGVAGALRLLLP